MSLGIHHGLTDISPSEAGYRESTLQQLDTFLMGLINEGKLQCASYMLARGGQTFAVRALGALRHTDPASELQPTSIRKIASVTKWFTLVSIMRLMEEGKLYLTQPVKDWYPEFDHRHYERITITHLLTHTSGLAPDPGYFTEPYPSGPWDIAFAFGDDSDASKPERTEAEDIAYRRSRWIKSVLAGPLVCQPGENWNYSSTGFSILGDIISQITGMSYNDYVRQTILEPLGMHRTFFEVPEELHHEVCTVDDWDLNRLTRTEDGGWSPPRAGGGLYSTLADMNRFGLMMLNQGTYQGARILSRRSVERLAQNQFSAGIPAFNWGDRLKDMPYGLSSQLGRVFDPFKSGTFYHEGAGRCALMVDAEEDFVVSFFVPTANGWVPESIVSIKNMIWSGLQ
ncbi:serine hydrolase domain-containing protein [Paenibacillus sp. GCM10027629]|uniref:serine hydrolase domain-containing protein n=1 Tax=Paenibacillus sp. GCM10027629 TaxID=3273414 RepID=UPI003634A8ED